MTEPAPIVSVRIMLEEFVEWADDCEHIFPGLVDDPGWRSLVEGSRAALKAVSPAAIAAAWLALE